ncbi:hypothetical protein K2X85_01600 [bacterium]|jgi:hypothetical protein|nr:hypothetical protein [bacterium]
MRRISIWGWTAILVTLAGCQSIGLSPGSPVYTGNSRPAIYPPPSSAQEEKRDARFFLAYPDESVMPHVDMLPREAN